MVPSIPLGSIPDPIWWVCVLNFDFPLVVLFYVELVINSWFCVWKLALHNCPSYLKEVVFVSLVYLLMAWCLFNSDANCMSCPTCQQFKTWKGHTAFHWFTGVSNCVNVQTMASYGGSKLFLEGGVIKKKWAGSPKSSLGKQPVNEAQEETVPS